MILYPLTFPVPVSLALSFTLTLMAWKIDNISNVLEPQYHSFTGSFREKLGLRRPGNVADIVASVHTAVFSPEANDALDFCKSVRYPHHRPPIHLHSRFLSNANILPSSNQNATAFSRDVAAHKAAPRIYIDERLAPNSITSGRKSFRRPVSQRTIAIDEERGTGEPPARFSDVSRGR